jgi:hypothetical protein
MDAHSEDVYRALLHEARWSKLPIAAVCASSSEHLCDHCLLFGGEFFGHVDNEVRHQIATI